MRAAQQSGVGEEAGVGDHPVVGPHRLALDVPAAVQHLDRLGHAEVGLVERLAELDGLGDLRRVGDEDPAGVQRPRRVLHDLPRLGQVEHDPVEVGLVDALVAVALLDPVARRHLVAEEGGDVLGRPRGEVLAQLVADDVGAGPQHRHRQRAGADAGLEHPRAREDVGQQQDRARGPSGRSPARRAAS